MASVSLTGRVAVVTGSSRGIGRAIAIALAEAGAAVVLSSSQAASVERVASELRTRGFPCIGVPCDVSELAQVEELFRQACAAYGVVDIWINNAGVSGPFARTTDVPVDEWERVIRVNLLGCYHGCRTVLPHMVARGYGKIINVSGGGASKAQRFLSAYSASKAAIVRLSDGLAREYASYSGLSINVLEPGIVRTDLIEHPTVIGDDAREAMQAIPWVLRVFGTSAEEAAALALRLASPATDGVSGRVFSVMPRRRALWRMARAVLSRSAKP